MKDATKIAVVLDRSGSMGIVREDTVGGFDAFIEEQKKKGGEARITLTQFDSEYEVVWDNIDLKEATSIDSFYQPRWSTALLDAIGRTIISVGKHLSDTPEEERPDKVIFVVLTDGHENSSQEFTRDTIMEMIRHQEEKYSWEFVFLGANQDAIEAGTSMGFKAGSSAQYAGSKEGTQKAFNKMSEKIGMYRSMSSTEREELTSGNIALFDDEDREELMS